MPSRAISGGLICCAALLAALPAQAAPSVLLGGSLDFGYDSNAGNAPQGAEEVDGATLDVGLNLSRNFEITNYASLLLRGSIQKHAQERVVALSSNKATGLMRVFLRPGRGLFTPTLSAWGSAAYWQFTSDMRDSDEYRYGLTLQQPLTTQVSVRLSAMQTERKADSGIFDNRQNSAAADFEWQAADALRFNIGFQFQEGDSVSTAAPTLKILLAAEEVQPDDAFGGIAADRYAYRIPAHTRIGSIGFNYALSPAFSLDTQVLYARASSDRWDTHYQRWIANTGLLWKFGL